MKIAILSRNPELYSTRRLKEEGEEMGLVPAAYYYRNARAVSGNQSAISGIRNTAMINTTWPITNGRTPL